MRGQWISNLSVPFETLSRLQLARRSAVSPDYAGATAEEKIERHRQGSAAVNFKIDVALIV